MRTVNLLSLVLVVFFVTSPALAIYDHFDNGQLDTQWQVVYDNAAGWTYNESGTNLTVSHIDTTNPNSNWNSVYLEQDFYASGDFEVTSRIAWDNESRNSSLTMLLINLLHGDTIVAQVGYHDPWDFAKGQKVGKVEYPLYYYGSGGILSYSGSTEVGMRRENDLVTILWNNDVILTGYSDLAVDRLQIRFGKTLYYNDYGNISIDYITAVPEPATICLFAIAGLLLRNKK